MKTIWKGQLARGGRKPAPFTAEIIEADGVVHLIERSGIEVKEVSPHEVNGQAWMDALVAAIPAGEPLPAAAPGIR